jgi:hypothetical protein
MNSKQWARWLVMAACVVALSLLFGVSPARTAPNKMWVAVMEDSTDAVITKTADRFGEVLAVAKFNEQVEVIRDLMEDDDNPRPYYRVKKATVTGYIKRNALAEKSQYQGDKADSEAKIAVGGAAANTAAKGLNSQNESTLRKGDPNFDKCVAQVDAMEKAINQSLVGADDTEPRARLGSYQAWGTEGMNVPKDPPKDSGKGD